MKINGVDVYFLTLISSVFWEKTVNKKILRILLGLVVGFSMPVFATQTLADFHGEMGGCENCHENGETASKDGAFEMQQCKECHGTLAEMDEVHLSHDGMMECSDCHQTHEMNVGQEPTCDACHDDGRSAK